jgi:hypothetical protein
MRRIALVLPVLLLVLGGCKSRDSAPATNATNCQPARFSSALDSTFQTLATDEHGHGHPRDLTTDYKFTPDSLSHLLTWIKSFDVPGNPPCNIGRVQGIPIQSWEYTLPEEQTPTLLRKIFFATDIPLLETGGSTHIQIIDYEIFRFSTPKTHSVANRPQQWL